MYIITPIRKLCPVAGVPENLFFDFEVGQAAQYILLWVCVSALWLEGSMYVFHGNRGC